MTDTITNLQDLPIEVWQELKRNAEAALRNSKISFYQYTTLLELAVSKIATFKTDDEKTETEALKDGIKELLA